MQPEVPLSSPAKTESARMTASNDSVYVHPSAVVSPSASIGLRTKIWCFVQVRENATIGADCTIAKGVYVDLGVKIGDCVKIQNNVSIYHGVTIESGVFIGPHVCFTNDRIPRAITTSGEPKLLNDWEITPIHVEYGASLGAHSVIVPGVRVGRFAMVGAGSVVTKNVPDHALVIGSPARVVGYVCACGTRLPAERAKGPKYVCEQCEATA
jgi:acetyltransferase-like isoleucine patch superfamily enzyme